MQGTAVLVFTNALFILMAFQLNGIGTIKLLSLILGLATALTFILYFSVKRKKLAA